MATEGGMTTIAEIKERSGLNQDQLQELVLKAQQGDRSVLPQLQEVLDANPKLWQAHGDLALQAQAMWLQLMAPRDLLFRESVQRKLEELRAELSGPSPSPLEKLLVERVVACSLQCHMADCLAAQISEQQPPIPLRQELRRRQESSQRRYLASIKQLATVRKLLNPGLSPFELAMRPVAEGNPEVRGRPASAPPSGVPVVN
jgi:hypothetical protein